MFHRNNVTIRAVTHHDQVTRNDAVMIASRGEYVFERMRFLGIDNSCICNFDETKISFSQDCNFTLSPIGVKDVVVIQGAFQSSQRFTVMIGVGGDGHKFPPYIIFKGSNNGPI
jgi:hypothetical protein